MCIQLQRPMLTSSLSLPTSPRLTTMSVRACLKFSRIQTTKRMALSSASRCALSTRIRKSTMTSCAARFYLRVKSSMDWSRTTFGAFSSTNSPELAVLPSIVPSLRSCCAPTSKRALSRTHSFWSCVTPQAAFSIARQTSMVQASKKLKRPCRS